MVSYVRIMLRHSWLPAVELFSYARPRRFGRADGHDIVITPRVTSRGRTLSDVRGVIVPGRNMDSKPSAYL